MLLYLTQIPLVLVIVPISHPTSILLLYNIGLSDALVSLVSNFQEIDPSHRNRLILISRKVRGNCHLSILPMWRALVTYLAF